MAKNDEAQLELIKVESEIREFQLNDDASILSNVKKLRTSLNHQKSHLELLDNASLNSKRELKPVNHQFFPSLVLDKI